MPVGDGSASHCDAHDIDWVLPSSKSGEGVVLPSQLRHQGTARTRLVNGNFSVPASTMQYEQLKAGRLRAGLTQKQAAERLGVSQTYLSQLEKGERPVTAELGSSATALYRLPATALPLPEMFAEDPEPDDALLARQLSGLGYPGFAHLRPRKTNPADRSWRHFCERTWKPGCRRLFRGSY